MPPSALTDTTRRIIRGVWVEVLMALIVEGYREFMEWWQTRAFLRPLRANDLDDAKSVADGHAEDVDRAALVADTVGWILDKHARKHIGIAVGVLWQGEQWTSRAVACVLAKRRPSMPTRSSRSAR